MNFILKKAISATILLLVSFFLAIMPLIFTSSLISNHFYYWVDELSKNNVNLTIALVGYGLENGDNEDLIKIIDKKISTYGRLYLKILKNNKIIYEKAFSEQYQNKGLGNCRNIVQGDYHIQYCSPAYPSAWYSLERYITCLFNGQVFSQFKYTDYFLLHLSLTFMILSLLNSYRVYRKNVLITKIYNKISPKSAVNK